MDTIHEQQKKLEMKLADEVAADDGISELERKKKEIDDQKVKQFEMELSKKREGEIQLEKQRIAQQKAEEREKKAIKELE